MMTSKRVILILASLACLASCSLASIEKEPIRVTHRNSGPRYDIDNEVERVRLGSAEPTTEPPAPAGEPASPDDTIGHVVIRRIFLVPIGGPRDDDNSRPFGWSSPAAGAAEQPHKPLSYRHIFMPSYPHSSQEGDEPMKSSAAGEREVSSEGSQELPRPMFDPMQFMMMLMNQALSQAANNKPAETTDNNPASTEVEKVGAEKPMSGENQAREEIVEIDGKKYLKKVVINRHIGDNIVFMTRRLIFTPLNETDSTPDAPASTSAPTVPASNNEGAPSTEQPTTAPSTVTVAPSTERVREETTPATLMVASEQSTASTSQPEATTTTTTAAAKESWVEKMAEEVERTAEKLAKAVGNMQASSTTTSTTTTTVAPTAA